MSEKWATIPDEKTIKETVDFLRNRGINVIAVGTGAEAMEKLKDIIPVGVEVMVGSSTTLDEIGFKDYLKSGRHGWKSLNDEIRHENDESKRGDMRRKSVTAEYFLGSVNAISRDGELVACDKTGSRTGAYLYAAKNLVLVVGVQKITQNLHEALMRVKEYVFPLEDARSKKAYGIPSATNKWIIIEGEVVKNRITLILVREKLGF